MIDPSLSQLWKQLSSHGSLVQEAHLKELLVEDPSRVEGLSFEIGNLHVDFSKQMLTKETLDLLVALGNELNLSEKIDNLFAGEIVNVSENRPALHTALRLSNGGRTDKSRVIKDELDKAKEFSLLVRSGKWIGATGKPIEAIVNIGIGGSHLGPLMANTALRSFAKEEMEMGEGEMDVNTDRTKELKNETEMKDVS